MKFFFSCMFVIFLCFPLDAMGGNFRVFPVRVMLGAAEKTDTLQIQNQGDAPISLQLQAKAWSQDSHGKDIFAENRNLIFFPQIFEIKPGEVRKVRLGYKNMPGQTEDSYRLFIEELPEAGRAAGENTLQVLLKMSVPVFIAQAREKTLQGEITGIAMQDGVLAVTLANTGNTYFFVKTIRAKGKKADGETVAFKEKSGWYLLNGNSIAYPLEIDAVQCSELKELDISVSSDTFSLERQFPIDAATCQK